MAAHKASLQWRRRADEVFTDGKYSRAHEWKFDGGAVVPASSSPSVVRVPFSDPAGVDPEEALVAALSSCHMLFFLDFASRAGFAVASYRDDAVGLMSRDERQREWMSLVTLKPNVTFDGAKRPGATEVDALHHNAHDHCFIANSFKGQVRIEGTFEA
jgi:organic hydroperoxide reductase OsmC/OhrA